MAKKIILIVIVLAVAFLSLSEIRAGKKAAESIPAASSPAAVSAPDVVKDDSVAVPAQPAGAEVTGMTEEQQKALIMDHYDLWSEVWDSGVDWFYTFTDLDHNGRMEVICASLQGSGIYTYADIWEVREDFSGISKCDDTLREGEAYPDMIVEATNCYYSESSGLYYYLFDDLARSGMAEHYTAKVVLCLDKGTVELHTICSKYEQYEDPESDPLVTYSDADGKAITKDAYDQAVANWAIGMNMSDFAMEWVQVNTGV